MVESAVLLNGEDRELKGLLSVTDRVSSNRFHLCVLRCWRTIFYSLEIQSTEEEILRQQTMIGEEGMIFIDS